jgi:glycosyltransferase involved in cell wall biosynthesis
MRIAYILTSLGIGGAERQVLWLARRMADAGHAVRIVVLLPRGDGDLFTESTSEAGSESLDVVYLGIQKRPLSVLRGLVRGVSAIRQFRPHLIHSHNFHGNLAGRLLGLFCGGIPVIATIHNVYEGGWPRMLAYHLTDPLSRRTIAVSEAARERYVRLGSVPTRKSGVVLNGIETASFSHEPERREAVRVAMGVTERDFVWIAVGRLAQAKDYPNLLRAFALVPEAKLWIVGDGDQA